MPYLRASRIGGHADRRMHVLLCVQGLRDTPQAQGKGLLRILLLRGRPLPADLGSAGERREERML